MIESPAPAPQEQIPSTQPSAPKRTARSRFWPGFVIGFALFTVASCSGAAIALGLNQFSLAELQGNGSVWTPPPYTPAPTVLPAAESAAAPVASTRFNREQTVRNLTNSRVNIRSSAGYLSKPDGDVIGILQPGAVAVVLGESKLADNLIWWRVRTTSTDGQTVAGWVAEATASGVQILGE